MTLTESVHDIDGPYGRRKRSFPFVGIVLLGFLLLALASIFWPVSGHRISPTASAVSRVKQLAIAAHIYAADHDDRLPLRDFSSLTIYLKKNDKFIEPATKKPFGYNNRLEAIRSEMIENSAEVVMFYSGANESLDYPYGDKRVGIVAFGDMRAGVVTRGNAVVWLPIMTMSGEK